ncbi:MAG: PEGA domain-containing protein, partial [Sandaracinaceae bacterium]|nr:PEGA domain-containing protein [Sandaracinaceae bacterium]
PPATPRRVSVQLASIPPGAQVRLGDRVLGRTPIVVPMEASGEAIGVTFTHEGYLDQTVSVVPSEDLRVPEVRLRRRRQAAQTDNGTSLPIKSVL